MSEAHQLSSKEKAPLRYTSFCKRLREMADRTRLISYRQTLQEAAAVIEGLENELHTMTDVARLAIQPKEPAS